MPETLNDVGTTKRGSMSETRRLRIWEAHRGMCCLCGEKIDGVREKWTIEHLRALGLGGEDVDSNCRPAHEDCRRIKDKDDVSRISKAKRQKANHIGIKKPKGRPMPGSKASGFKKRLDGTVERRMSFWPAGRNTEGD